jgi:hypothetical protein
MIVAVARWLLSRRPRRVADRFPCRGMRRRQPAPRCVRSAPRVLSTGSPSPRRCPDLPVTVGDQGDAGFLVCPQRQAMPHLLYWVARVPEFVQQRRDMRCVAWLSRTDGAPCLRVHCRLLLPDCSGSFSRDLTLRSQARAAAAQRPAPVERPGRSRRITRSTRSGSTG